MRCDTQHSFTRFPLPVSPSALINSRLGGMSRGDNEPNHTVTFQAFLHEDGSIKVAYLEANASTYGRPGSERLGLVIGWQGEEQEGEDFTPVCVSGGGKGDCDAYVRRRTLDVAPCSFGDRPLETVGMPNL